MFELFIIFNDDSNRTYITTSVHFTVGYLCFLEVTKDYLTSKSVQIPLSEVSSFLIQPV